MAVRWPDGSYTGSVKAETPEPAPVEPDSAVESEQTTTEPEKAPEKKEVGHADR